MAAARSAGARWFAGPAGELELRVPRLVATRGAVVVLHQHGPVGADEHRAVRLLPRLEGDLGEVDGAAEMFEIDVVHGCVVERVKVSVFA